MWVSLGRNDKLGLFKSTSQWLWILNLEIRLLHSSESCVWGRVDLKVLGWNEPLHKCLQRVTGDQTPKVSDAAGSGAQLAGPRPAASLWCGPLYFSWEGNRKWERGDHVWSNGKIVRCPCSGENGRAPRVCHGCQANPHSLWTTSLPGVTLIPLWAAWWGDRLSIPEASGDRHLHGRPHNEAGALKEIHSAHTWAVF